MFLLLFWLHLYIAFMQHHDLFAKAQANSASAFTGTEEWNKYFPLLRGHTIAIIRYFDTWFASIRQISW